MNKMYYICVEIMGYYTKVEVVCNYEDADGVNIPIKKIIQVQNEFTYMYGNNMYLTINLDKSAIILFQHLCSRMDDGNICRFKDDDIDSFLSIYKKLSMDFGVAEDSRYMKSKGSVVNVIKRLKKAGAITTVKYGYVMVNPIFASKGKGRRRKDLIHNFFNYSPVDRHKFDLLEKRTKF